MRDRIELKAMAKINLGLDVLRKREDGYHEVKMVMQTVHLYDEIEIRRSRKPGITLHCNIPYLPTNENNLMVKAASLLMEEFSITDGLQMNLRKKIPVAAGMAGGSSDAAVTLWGVNRMFDLGLSKKALMERGVKLGADVPYCILRGTALAEGIGEKLSLLPPMPDCYLLIAKPGISVSTKFVYENLHVEQRKAQEHPDIDALMESLKAQDLSGMVGHMGNILETVTEPAYPVITQIKEKMMAYGAMGAMMSGSGPTVFGVFSSFHRAKRAYRALLLSGLVKQLQVVTPYNPKRPRGGRSL